MSRYSPITATVSKQRMIEILRRPVITEKATLIGEYNQVAFLVPVDANKFEVKSAVEELFKVKVTSVNTLRVRGKVKRHRGELGQRAETKKAIVTLAEGQNIDVTTGI
ncbi:MAG: 50S ribosomal protein L23 [Rhodospirillaceae bacterium]